MHILPLVVVALFVLVAFVLVALKAKRTRLGSDQDSYYVKKSLFSAAELSFLGVLESACPEGVALACKVRLADIFGVKRGLDRGGRQRAFNRISAKHVDFVLLQRANGRPLLGIELDDSSHEDEDRRARDVFVDGVFSSAGMPILHVDVKAAYGLKELRNRIVEAIAYKS